MLDFNKKQHQLLNSQKYHKSSSRSSLTEKNCIRACYKLKLSNFDGLFTLLQCWNFYFALQPEQLALLTNHMQFIIYLEYFRDGILFLFTGDMLLKVYAFRLKFLELNNSYIELLSGVFIIIYCIATEAANLNK